MGAEPLIVVNAGLGSALDAAALVAYVNGPVGIAMGDDEDDENENEELSRNTSYTAPLVDPLLLRRVAKEEPHRRAANGAINPWGCSWWGVGNEAYGEWQLGYGESSSPSVYSHPARKGSYFDELLLPFLSLSIFFVYKCQSVASCGATGASRGP